MILEHAARSTKNDCLTWDSVKEIVLEPKKGRVCLVYSRPAHPKFLYSLAFKPGFYWGNFVDAARYFAPEKVREGKIGPVTSPWTYAAVLLLFGLIVGFVVYLSLQ